MNDVEAKTIAAFILKEKQERYRFLFDTPGRRREGLRRLNHCRDFDPRFATWITLKTDIAALLKQEGSPQTVYVMSSHSEIDGKLLPLDEVITPAGYWGTLVSCIPGQLAYYYDECGERRAILKRSSLK